MKTNTDDLIEMITVRLNNYVDTHIVQETLKDLVDAFGQPGYRLRAARLYKSSQVDNDWAIYLYSPPDKRAVKSSLAISLADALRNLGLVHHTVWRPCDTDDLDEKLPRQILKN